MDDKGLYKRHMEDRKGAEQTEAEVRVMLPQAKGCPGPPETGSSKEGSLRGFLPKP